jgi:hypothetical protein
MSDWKQQIDQYERNIIESLNQITAITDQVSGAVTPRVGGDMVPVFLSGRWKLRDGTMFGR